MVLFVVGAPIIKLHCNSESLGINVLRFHCFLGSLGVSMLVFEVGFWYGSVIENTLYRAAQ